MNKEIWDILIVGAGPAGMTAGIYAGRSKMKTLILEKGSVGGLAAITDEIENYPGFGKGSTGPGITKAMKEQAEGFDVVIEKESVIDMELNGDIKTVKTESGKEYHSKSIVLCLGANPRLLGVKGEKEFSGKGVSYCATCDGVFFTDEKIVLVGGGDAALDEAIYLTKFATEVTIIHRRDELRAAKIIQERAMNNPKINFIWDSVVEEIKGDGLVDSVSIKNVKTGEITEMETAAVFIFVGYIPNAEFLRDKIQLDDQGYIIVNERMETSVPGVYAAGDANQKYLRQVVTAAADGAIAAFAADKYLSEKD